VTATNDVVPLTHADLYSYSSWDVDFDPGALAAALDYLASKAPPSALFGRRNIYLGEFGAAKDQVPDNAERPAVIRRLTAAALGWGVRYAVYWELYCNEPARPFLGRPDNQDMRGFWLIRPDGVRTAMWSDLQHDMPTRLLRVALRAPSGRYLEAAGAGGGPLAAHADAVGDWQVFTVEAQGEQPLHSGEQLLLQAHNGMVVGADPSPHATVGAGDWEEDRSRLLVIRSAGGGAAALADGDLVTLETAAGGYLTVDAQNGAVSANRRTPGPDSLFRLELQR
jgi:hypothetical protein